MYRQDAFKAYFIEEVGAAKATYNTYNSYLNRIDQFIGGLDERVAQDGIEAVLAWSKDQFEGPFSAYPSHARSVLKRYLQFVLNAESDGQDDEEELQTDVAPQDPTGAIFRLEREMQAAVRRQLAMLEIGLEEADGGIEVSVATGRIDILAKAANGQLVVIELKAGPCPTGALEQVLGYAQALEDEKGEPVRAYLIASSFPDRIRAAAKRVSALELRTYEFSMTFKATAS
ncbi:MAG: endonuclease NucS domain-containing protein [Brevundimonas sp.]